MDARHTPANLPLFLRDLAEAKVVTVAACHGDSVFRRDCYAGWRDEMRLVLEPALITSYHRSNGTARLHVVPLDQAIQVEINHGMSDHIEWLRGPNGLWLRHRP